eukprot:5492250-Prymnesium_polylepis.1
MGAAVKEEVARVVRQVGGESAAARMAALPAVARVATLLPESQQMRSQSTRVVFRPSRTPLCRHCLR